MPDLRQKTIDVDVKSLKAAGGDGASLGENVLAEFTCCVTSQKADRDNDIWSRPVPLFDMQQALLLKHDPTQPVGKLLGIVERDDDKIVAKSRAA